MENDKYIVFLDIDGTLLHGKYLPEENIKAIQTVRQAGHRVFINTGRTAGSPIMKLFDKVEFDGYVFGLGADITAGKDVIFRSCLDHKQLALAIAPFFDFPYPKIVLEGRKTMLAANMDTAEFTVFYSPDELLTKYADVELHKLSAYQDATEQCRESLASNYTLLIHARYMETAIPGCSKADGMKKVCDYYKTDMVHTIAIGDSINDEEMLRAAGISVAMGNAGDEIKFFCSHLTGRAEDGGVAQALYKILKL